MEIVFKKLSERAVQPTQTHMFDAWYDLSATQEYTLQPWERQLFPTDIAISIPQWWYGRIAPRSWLALKYGIDVLAWVIDHSYTGNVWVLLINFWTEPFTIHSWDRIAQLIIEKCAQVERVETSESAVTTRWEGWFWSTWV